MTDSAGPDGRTGAAGGPEGGGSELRRRRDLLRWVLDFSLVGTLGALLYPVVRYLQPKAGGGSGPMQVVAPYRVSDLHVDPEGNWPSPFNFGGIPCLVIKTETGKVRAFDAICTHLDCTVKFRPQRKDIYCACHGGVYDLLGRNVSGPPPRPLGAYKVTLRGKPGQEEIIVSK